MKVTGYIVEEGKSPRCPIEICGAVCCRATHFRPDKLPPCEYLEPDLTCELHNAGGIRCKPLGCAEYPRSQADIDGINRQAEAAGLSERCQLRVE